MKNILIVDDDKNILIVLSELVRISLGGSHIEPVEIVTAVSGKTRFGLSVRGISIFF